MDIILLITVISFQLLLTYLDRDHKKEINKLLDRIQSESYREYKSLDGRSKKVKGNVKIEEVSPKKWV